MSDDMGQLDQLNESDIMAALGQEVPENLEAPAIEEETSEFVEGTDGEDHEFLHETPDGEVTNIPDGLLEADDEDEEDESDGEELEDIDDIEILPMAEIESALEEEEETITMNSEDAGNLASILSKLLNNKTIEITIRVKD